jgi:hypothetical protein
MLCSTLDFESGSKRGEKEASWREAEHNMLCSGLKIRGYFQQRV